MKAKKKKFDYFESLVNMSLYALQEAKLLKEIIVDFNHETLGERRKTMHDLEHRCDTEKHELTTALAKEFLPPIERDDLFRLSHVTDNLTDAIDGVAAFLYMADIRAIRPDSAAFADLIIECCEGACELLREFRNFKKPVRLNELIILLNDLEERGDKLYSEAVRKLSAESKSTREVIEWRDIYKKFEFCFDAAESIADNVESAVLKNS